MVTFCVTKMITTRSPMVEQVFDTMIVATSDSVSNNPSKSKRLKLFEQLYVRKIMAQDTHLQ